MTGGSSNQISCIIKHNLSTLLILDNGLTASRSRGGAVPSEVLPMLQIFSAATVVQITPARILCPVSTDFYSTATRCSLPLNRPGGTARPLGYVAPVREHTNQDLP